MPWEAPEFLYSVKVAESISKLHFGPVVYLERQADEIFKGKKLPKKWTPSQKIDIVVESKMRRKIRTAIEIKRTRHFPEKDVKRLQDLLKFSDCREGLSLFIRHYYIDNEMNKWISEEINEIKMNLKPFGIKFDIQIEKCGTVKKEDYGEAWFVFGILIRGR